MFPWLCACRSIQVLSVASTAMGVGLRVGSVMIAESDGS